MWEQLKIIFADIKIQHTVFALPFAVMSAFLAAEGLPTWEQLLWILLCMFGARNAAMAFNRIVDARLDSKNPRTENRALPAGKVGMGQYWAFLIVSSAVFIFAAGMLNRLALWLSPVALAIVFFYSITKRFTPYSHVFLGFALSVAPVGAWVAIREEISFTSLVLGAAVVFWLTGFDIIYACMDVEADKKNRLHSIPEHFGVGRGLLFARAAHAMMVLFLLGVMALSPLLGVTYLVGVLAVAGLLIYEHSLVREDDLTRVNIAFFNVNGLISLTLMTLVIIDCMWV
ncbi:4-hydroxybenzoate polyprenyltransferase and related prenyltransferases [Nitrospina gracilis 3/211]|uniref:4-hydroxybenzoate polyprenyltransferase n=1 Tax=Nitrospina gracilis (strain 3/211) TaxID=1266370 RepID=M1Z104_NITG3|nr:MULTISPECIES: UbiA-like polyprenyltransferase [Nitrospina]MCF8724049.1 4-hydroxybenzoate polyprenyltransferase [Nitrospina sp. Nb-3]CCQ91179.1 4-hydroxybenzoate polyprenyltransferase and related prenyltransferases [Nitrospina gracilis 3/211]